MMPLHSWCGIQMTQRGLVLDHKRVVVSTMIDVVNDTRKVQRNFLTKRKHKRVVTKLEFPTKCPKLASFASLIVRSLIGTRYFRELLSQSDTQPKTTMTYTHAFSRTWRNLIEFDTDRTIQNFQWGEYVELNKKFLFERNEHTNKQTKPVNKYN